jgi:hypothetical protein
MVVCFGIHKKAISNTTMIQTDLWKLVSNKDTPFEEIQTYLSSPVSMTDLQTLATTIRTWRLNPVYGVNERWVIQVLLVRSHPHDIGVDNTSDIYARCSEWVALVESVYSPRSASSASPNSEFGNSEYGIDDVFIRKTMTLKVAYEEWKQKDIRDQLYVLVELYLYYKDIISEYDAYFRMNAMDGADGTADGKHEYVDGDEKGDSISESSGESYLSMKSMEEEIRVWYNVYIDFADKLLSLIKVYVPRNYQQWIDGIGRTRPTHAVTNESVVETIRWSYWKDKEEQFKNASSEEVRIQIRETIVKEWMDMAPATASSRIVVQSDTASDEALVLFLIDTCEKNDKRSAESMYSFLRGEYESRRYSFIQVLSLLFHRWSQLSTPAK